MKKQAFFMIAFMAYTQAMFPYPKKMVINVPVVNLNFKPEHIDPSVKLPTLECTNPLLITQMLMNEYVCANSEYIDQNGNKWLNINAIQQENFITPLGWHGYPGWIPAAQATEVSEYPTYNVVIKNLTAEMEDYAGNVLQTFSMGTRFKAVKVDKEYWKITLENNHNAYFQDTDIYQIKPKVKESIQDLRESIIETAKKFLNFPYSWGGRIAYNPNFGNISSVDCSGLLNVSFLAHGLQIPRMSKDQFLHSLEIKDGSQLNPADFIFFASVRKNPIQTLLNKHPLYIDHVMMYIGNNEMIESTGAQDAMNVRIIDCKERIGKACCEIVSGEIISYNDEEYYVYFGTFFTQEMIQTLRDDALKSNYEI